MYEWFNFEKNKLYFFRMRFRGKYLIKKNDNFIDSLVLIKIIISNKYIVVWNFLSKEVEKFMVLFIVFLIWGGGVWEFVFN